MTLKTFSCASDKKASSFSQRWSGATHKSPLREMKKLLESKFNKILNFSGKEKVSFANGSSLFRSNDLSKHCIPYYLYSQRETISGI